MDVRFFKKNCLQNVNFERDITLSLNMFRTASLSC